MSSKIAVLAVAEGAHQQVRQRQRRRHVRDRLLRQRLQQPPPQAVAHGQVQRLHPRVLERAPRAPRPDAPDEHLAALLPVAHAHEQQRLGRRAHRGARGRGALRAAQRREAARGGAARVRPQLAAHRREVLQEGDAHVLVAVHPLPHEHGGRRGDARGALRRLVPREQRVHQLVEQPPVQRGGPLRLLRPLAEDHQLLDALAAQLRAARQRDGEQRREGALQRVAQPRVELHERGLGLVLVGARLVPLLPKDEALREEVREAAVRAVRRGGARGVRRVPVSDAFSDPREGVAVLDAAEDRRHQRAHGADAIERIPRRGRHLVADRVRVPPARLPFAGRRPAGGREARGWAGSRALGRATPAGIS